LNLLSFSGGAGLFGVLLVDRSDEGCEVLIRFLSRKYSWLRAADGVRSSAIAALND
jgi:hypothetical protein